MQKPQSHLETTEDVLVGIEDISDYDLVCLTKDFLGRDVIHLSQEQIDIQLKRILIEIGNRNIDSNSLFSFALPNKVTQEEIRSGNSAAAKVYRALFNFSTSPEYRDDPKYHDVARNLENTIDQDPQMMGPVALWKIAQDMLWRRDVPPSAKQSIIGSMTYAISFFDHTEYREELLKQLDLKNPANYAQTAHLLEAIKYFWEDASQYYATESGAKAFYTETLKKVKETPDTNYILLIRLQEIVSLLEKNSEFIFETQDITPFELSKGIYAHQKTGGGLAVIPEDKVKEAIKLIDIFRANETKITPPQHLIDAAIERGDDFVSWLPPQELMTRRQEIIRQMYSLPNINIEEKVGETTSVSEETQAELLFDYEYLVSRPIRTIIQKEFGFELKDLSIREQFYCLNYLKKVKVAEIGRVKKFIKLHGITGLRTFLSLGRGQESLGDKIVMFGQNTEIATRVFTYYSELLDSADQAENIVRKLSNCIGNVCVELANQVRENILNRAQKDLEKAVESQDTSHTEELIKNYIVQAKEYVAILQELGMKDIEHVASKDLVEEDRNQMRNLLKTNYESNYRDEADFDFRNAISESLEKAFKNPNTVFNLVRDNSNIVSFNRFDTITDASGKTILYFGSVNAHPAYSGLGSIMVEESVKNQLEGRLPIMAHCDPKQPITKKYIEDGFCATRFQTIFNKPSFEIWRSFDSNQQFESKKLSHTELIELTQPNDSIIVRETQDQEDYPELLDGKVLTRYFVHKEKTYIVFETISSQIKEQFTYTQ